MVIPSGARMARPLWFEVSGYRQERLTSGFLESVVYVIGLEDEQAFWVKSIGMRVRRSICSDLSLFTHTLCLFYPFPVNVGV